jgi:hypothetical protein
MPVQHEPGTAAAIIAAMEAAPHLSEEDIAEFEQALAAGKRPAAPIDLFAENMTGPS